MSKNCGDYIYGWSYVKLLANISCIRTISLAKHLYFIQNKRECFMTCHRYFINQFKEYNFFINTISRYKMANVFLSEPHMKAFWKQKAWCFQIILSRCIIQEIEMHICKTWCFLEKKFLSTPLTPLHSSINVVFELENFTVHSSYARQH